MVLNIFLIILGISIMICAHNIIMKDSWMNKVEKIFGTKLSADISMTIWSIGLMTVFISIMKLIN